MRPNRLFHQLVDDYKRGLIVKAVYDAKGNRTRAAQLLGLQRTHLLTLIRTLMVVLPPPRPRREEE